jgi:hypothetical protein
MPRRQLENSAGTGTLTDANNQTVTLAYTLRIVQDVRHEPGFGDLEDTPELHIAFPEGTGGISGPATFRTKEGRTVTCDVDSLGGVTITGSLTPLSV